MHRSWFDFSYLSKGWFLARFNIVCSFADIASFIIPGVTLLGIPIISLCALIFSLSGNCFVISACTTFLMV